MMRMILITEKPNRRATRPSTMKAKKAMAKYTGSTSLASGSSELKPKLATVTAIRANTPIGA
ncbi:hypothetical protein D9M68_895720 [compost metagenome]